MFTQQLTSELFPSLGDGPAEPSLNDGEIVRRLLERHTGYGQFRIVLPLAVTWSKEAARVRGAAADAVDMSLEDAVKAYLPADRKRLVDTVTAAIEQRRAFTFVGRRVDDTVKIIEMVGDVKVENGVVTELIGLVRDVSARVEQEALAISRAQLIRRIVEDMPVPVVVLDRALRVVVCSAPWAESHGLGDRKEALGKPITALIEVSHELTAAFIEAMGGATANLVLPFYDAEDARQVQRRCTVMPWQCGSDAPGGVLMLVGEGRPPYATLEVADRALGRRTTGLMDMLEAM